MMTMKTVPVVVKMVTTAVIAVAVVGVAVDSIITIMVYGQYL